jgi:hypothetical protein
LKGEEGCDHEPMGVISKYLLAETEKSTQNLIQDGRCLNEVRSDNIGYRSTILLGVYVQIVETLAHHSYNQSSKQLPSNCRQTEVRRTA